MTLSRTFPLIGGVLLAALLAGCAGNAQTPANEDPAAAKAGTTMATAMPPTARRPRPNPQRRPPMAMRVSCADS